MSKDASRIWIPEGRYTWGKSWLDEFLQELDMRLNGAEAYVDFTYTSDLITLIEIHSDLARTNKVAERQIGYTSGKITSITTIFFNPGGSEDSRVTETLTRDAGNLDRITACDSVFTTTESPKE